MLIIIHSIFQAPDGTVLVDEENFKETHQPCAYSDPLVTVIPLEKPAAPRMSYLGQYALGWTEGYYNGECSGDKIVYNSAS